MQADCGCGALAQDGRMCEKHTKERIERMKSAPTPKQREEREIKPCPFCGAEAEYDRIAAPQADMIGVRIVCSECRAGITTRSGPSEEETEAAALSAWNRRTHSPSVTQSEYDERRAILAATEGPLEDGVMDAISWLDDGVSASDVMDRLGEALQEYRSLRRHSSEEPETWTITFCPECGWGAAVDEDGLCLTCGCTAVGRAVEEMACSLRTDEPSEQASEYPPCGDCGTEVWYNAWVEDDVWETIRPEPGPPGGGGLLCVRCIDQRCVDAGMEDVAVRWCWTGDAAKCHSPEDPGSSVFGHKECARCHQGFRADLRDVYRCVECSLPFHQSCAKMHFRDTSHASPEEPVGWKYRYYHGNGHWSGWHMAPFDPREQLEVQGLEYEIIALAPIGQPLDGDES